MHLIHNIINKYFDLFVSFLSAEYYLPNASTVETIGDLCNGVYAYDVESKIRYLKEQVMPLYDTYFSENNQATALEDEYFNELTLSINDEINNMFVYSEHIVETENYFANLGVDCNVREQMQNSCYSIGGVSYNQLEVLQYIENNIPLPYLIDIDCEDVCPSNLYSDQRLENASKVSKYALQSKWPSTIRYRNYNCTCPNMSIATSAMIEWAQATDNYLRFIEIPDNGWNRFLWTLGCSYHICLGLENDPNLGGTATIGYRPWANMQVRDDAGLSTYLHEFGHILGLVHEFKRPDRDDYVIINCSNIKIDYLHNFKKHNDIEVNNYGSFDINSIMMYSSYSSMAIDVYVPVLLTISGGTIGENHVLSVNDKLRIKEIYH